MFDVTLDSARPRKDDERPGRFLEASLAPRADHEGRLEQVVVAAIGAGADEGLVEGELFLGDLVRREGIPWGERLGDKGDELRQVQRLIDVPGHRSAGLEGWVGQIGDAFAPIPVKGDLVRREDAILRLGFGHHVGHRIAIRDGQLALRVDELDAHPLRLRLAPATEQREHDVLAADPGPQFSAEDHAPALRRREIDVAGRPAEAELRAAHAGTDGAVRAIGATVRIGPGDERAGDDQPLLGEIKVEDPIARRRVVGLVNLVQRRKIPPDPGLLVVGVSSRKHEVVVCDGGLPRIDRVATGDLIEGVDRKRRGAVGGWQ